MNLANRAEKLLLKVDINLGVRVHEVKFQQHNAHVYVRVKCMPQTRLNATPYKLYVIIASDGHIISGECKCVV